MPASMTSGSRIKLSQVMPDGLIYQKYFSKQTLTIESTLKALGWVCDVRKKRKKNLHFGGAPLNVPFGTTSAPGSAHISLSCIMTILCQMVSSRYSFD